MGETAGGGSHPVVFKALDHGFGMVVPNGYPTHPVTQSNWEGSGVLPDIEVPRESALEIAHIHAL
jgi:hypothetical protein